MPCFYCGKPISLMRRLTDPDFCSDDHRQKYRELTRLALNRLMETRDHLETAPKRRRPRGAPTAEPQAAPTPPMAELIQERMAAVPIVVRSSLPGEFTVVAHTLRLPGIRPPQHRPAPPMLTRAPTAAPGPFESAEPPRVAVPAEGAFLLLAVGEAPSEFRLGLRAPPRPGFPLYSIRKPRGMVAAGGGGRVSAPAPSPSDVCALRLPPPISPPPRVAPPRTELRGIATDLTVAPAAPAAAIILDGEIRAPAPVAPRPMAATLHSGVKMAARWCAEPSSTPPCVWPTPSPPAQAPLTFPPPLPRSPRPADAGAVRLALCPPIAQQPAGALQAAAFTVADAGRPVAGVAWDITFRHSSIWRLQPVAFELPPLTIPPVVSELLSISMQQPAVPEGRAVVGSGPDWRPGGLGLPQVGRRAAEAVLGWAPLMAGRMPGLAGPGLGILRLAPSPDFRVSRQFYIGWAATSLRRALGPGEPVVVEPGASRDVISGVRESPAPGFRIAVWAFTHAPGLRRATVPPVGAVLTSGLPLPAAQAGSQPTAVAGPATPGASPVLPAWRARLTGEWWLGAAVEPPRPAEACRVGIEPTGGATHMLPVQVDFPLPGHWLAEGLHRHASLAWASPTYQLNSGAALPIQARSLGQAWQVTSQWEQAPLVLSELPARRPWALQPVTPVFSAASLVVEATSSPIEGPTPEPVPTLAWQALEAASAAFGTVRSEPSSPAWAPAGHWPVKPFEAVAGLYASRPVSVAMALPPVVPPPASAIAACGLLLTTAPSPLSAAPPCDSAATWSRRSVIAVPAEPPSRTALPRGVSAAAEARLPVAWAAAAETPPLDAPKPPPLPQQVPPALSKLAMPAGAGMPAWVIDLAWPHACPVGPIPRNLASAPQNQPKEVPLQPFVLLQARPITPIRHRFERLPVEPQFVPTRGMARLWKRVPRRLVFALAGVALVVLLGSLIWNAMRESVRQRAAVVLDEDFSAGMLRWTAGAADWSRDPAGSVQVGSLALLGPSLRMSDYRFQFMGEIERQSLSWVFRAQAPDNYYAMRIAVLKPGPLPDLALVRARVILGQETQLGQVPLRVILHNNAPFRVLMRIRGNDFITFVNNQQVDFWSDDRLRSGGVGFFCEKGALARLYWIKITHQDDLVGKLCSYLAPNDLLKNGSWKW